MGRGGEASDLDGAGRLLAHRADIDLGVIDDRIHLLCSVSDNQAFWCEGKFATAPDIDPSFFKARTTRKWLQLGFAMVYRFPILEASAPKVSKAFSLMRL